MTPNRFLNSARLSLLAAAVGVLFACGPVANDPGYTDCGNQVCQPGQYCFSPQAGMCDTGCTSDANCQSGHVCQNIDDVIGVGTCSEDDAPAPDLEPEPQPEPEDALAACQEACDGFQQCGLGAADTAECRNDCTALSENQQIVVGNCREGSCSDKRTCLGVDCFADADCGSGEVCLDYSCL